jgi:hypothetical protein
LFVPEDSAADLYILVDIGKNVMLNGEVYSCVWFGNDEVTIVADHSDAVRGSKRHSIYPPKDGHTFDHQSGPKMFMTRAPKYLQPLVYRYTTCWQAIGVTGGNFSMEHESRSMAQADQHFETMSKPLDGQQYDVFISYRWMIGRWRLLLTMLIEFNHLQSFILAYALTILIEFIAGIINTYTEVRILPHISIPKDFAGNGSWVFSTWFITLVMTFGLLFYSQVFSRKKLFLDKNCSTKGFQFDQFHSLFCIVCSNV